MKVKTIKKKINQDDTIINLFNTMLGIKDADPVLIESKYENLLHYLGKIVSVWEIFYRSSFFKDVLINHSNCQKDFNDFIINSKKFLEENTLKPEVNKIKTDLSTDNLIEDLYELGSKYNKTDLNKCYRNIKNSDLLKHVNITLNNIKILLEDDKKRSGAVISCLDAHTHLSNSFIIKTDLDTKLLSWSNLDFGYIYNTLSEQINSFDKLILFSLHITYINAINCYKIIMEPDIDIDQFVEAFSNKLDNIKHVIPDCDAAFKTLKKSLGLLKNNFASYYKKFVTTNNNPGIIFESFLADVTEKNKKNITVLVQFKKIISYIKDNLPKNLKENSTVNKLWDISDNIFKNVNYSTNQDPHNN